MKKGFTLIEILIVVAIIAILTSVVIIGLGPAQRSGRDTRRAADLRQVQNALELYFQRCGFYPGPALTAGDSCPAFAAAADYAAMRTSVLGSGLGIANIPATDPSGRAYLYGVNSTVGQSYVLGALLDDARSSLLQNDVDGTPFTVDCGTVAGGAESPPVYCIGL